MRIKIFPRVQHKIYFEIKLGNEEMYFEDDSLNRTVTFEFENENFKELIEESKNTLGFRWVENTPNYEVPRICLQITYDTFDENELLYCRRETRTWVAYDYNYLILCQEGNCEKAIQQDIWS